MSGTIPKRSLGGCLTCKRRKKKCDERRPCCRRCEMGDFKCQGYTLPNASYAEVAPFTAIIWPSNSHTFGSFDSLVPTPDYTNKVEQPPSGGVLFQGIQPPPSNIPRSIPFDPTMLDDIKSLIVSQYVKISQEALFKPPPLSIEAGVLRRISDSTITHWSMYLGARLITDILNGNNIQKYLGLIFRFCQQLTETPSSNEQMPSLRGRLSGLYDLMCFGAIISGTATGYSLLRRCTPVLLRLAALYPNLWVNNSSISVPETFRNWQYEVTQFIIHDTITALALGIPSILQYDTTASWVDKAPGHYMEWVHGFPVGLLILLAEINAWRTSRMMGEINQNQTNFRSIEHRLNTWNPIMDYTGEPDNDIARLAIQEACRQATLVYLYMGMCEVNSVDPRVERAVEQIVRLGNTITSGSFLERHLLIPCLIAGVAARQEKHRATLRGKITTESPKKVNSLVLPMRGSDFVPVLDHLWHGVGSGGCPVMWEDYVKSRCAVLSLHA
ncbi:unnamed protein product [Rhizoctonia solani]|uniref:Zn(2)-C6 fungal-type domain-containing protein n=1 Tax=Rhizoctonia solani TaxID=456999 RepID=A0A8H3CDI4_9AGAM|nr:unnamed protein product [Rhizoctonia solani]